jgi:carbonic anhydrase
MPEFAELVEGYRRFRKDMYPIQRERFEETIRNGQQPKLMVIGCSDSRVGPEHIFDVDPGEIFVLRNVAALVPPFERTPGKHGVSAAIEFAVQFLEVKQILILGHGRCGGCKAALDQSLASAAPGDGGFVAGWIKMLDDARDEVIAKYGNEGREAELAMEQAAVRQSIANLRTFPWVKEKEAAGKLKLRGAHFAIHGGDLSALSEIDGEFERVE